MDKFSIDLEDLYDDSEEADASWLQCQFQIRDLMGMEKLPDLQGILFSIGLQELGQLRDDFSKEERQDLMHIAVCRLLSYDGYFELVGYDDEGWPHWKLIEQPPKGRKAQESLLKQKIQQYLKNVEESY